MSRAARLLDLIQLLRRHRYPVAGQALANDLGISLRTLYRDIASLQAQGAGIEGEPGLGYVLRPGFMLPPLMFSEEEIEAIALGIRWVRQHGDPALAVAARDALAKIAAVLPEDARKGIDASGLAVPPAIEDATAAGVLPRLRYAIRAERKVEIAYRDRDEIPSSRIIWPIALAFFERSRVVAAWCELRQDFRHFRTDRINDLKVSDQRYPSRRHDLTREWREKEGIPAAKN